MTLGVNGIVAGSIETTPMNLLAIGINHNTAPVALREQAVFSSERLSGALHDVVSTGLADEVTILSTCNRTELYCRRPTEHHDDLVGWLCNYHDIPRQTIAPSLYQHPNEDAVRHAFRVASGLDSMVLGEPQILGQMKAAFATAHRDGSTGKVLNRLFHHTFSVAKQVRTDTAIGANSVSVAYAAVDLAKRIFTRIEDRTVLLLGAGETIELTARHLYGQGVRRMIVANRSIERAARLAQITTAEAISLAELASRIHEADIVITSTASTLPIVGKGTIERALKRRKHRPMLLIDLAVPRDIEAEVAALDDVYLYTVDDLQQAVDTNLQVRREAALEAETIIDLQAMRFMGWLRSLDSVPTIRALRSNADSIRSAEVERALHRLTQGADPQTVIEQLSTALTNKLIHAPSAALERAGRYGDRSLLAVARRLFGLTR